MGPVVTVAVDADVCVVVLRWYDVEKLPNSSEMNGLLVGMAVGVLSWLSWGGGGGGGGYE